jgi:hypothetical protein
MTPANVEGPRFDSTLHESAKKEWRQPGLRKLPIAATAGSQGHPPDKRLAGNEGNTAKGGDANFVS